MDNKENLGLPYKVDALEKKQEKMEKKQESTDIILQEIREGLGSIKEALSSNKEQEDLKSQLLLKDIDGMKERIDKLESNQKWLVTSLIGEILSIIFGVIMIFINKGI